MNQLKRRNFWGLWQPPHSFQSSPAAPCLSALADAAAQIAAGNCWQERERVIGSLPKRKSGG
ncbi:MAG: hypothetical protein ACLQVL_29660 [Terriglobia bacterium]